jgi:hypothetical protein
VIENEHELQAVRNWLRYWKSIVADGDQSWLGGENARTEVMRYARAIADYERRRVSGEAAEAGSDDIFSTSQSPDLAGNT